MRIPDRRCCNLDWFEIYCLEPITKPLTADYFRGQGYFLQEREYGTRVFRQMFTLEDTEGHPWLEVRRDPASTMDNGGVLPINACHLRLTNRACYVEDIIKSLDLFMQLHGYEFKAITRVDVCLDLVRFDSGDDPQSFVRRYLKRKYSKINQGNIHAHGEDRWTGQSWNSVSWGKPTSMVSTKFYNKTIELKEVKDKPYIRQAWFESKLIDNPYSILQRTSKGLQPVYVWRLEFSIKSSLKGWYTIEEDGIEGKYHSYRNNLNAWYTREDCWQKMASLIPHYFRFKYFKAGVRKDRCEDKQLFDLTGEQHVYHIERIAGEQRRDVLEQQLLAKLRAFREKHFDAEVRAAVDIIIRCIHNGEIVSDYGSPFTRAELIALQQTITRRMYGDTRDPAIIQREILALLKSAEDKPF